MKIMLEHDAILPTRAHSTDAGLDLYSREDKMIPSRNMAMMGYEDTPIPAEIGVTFDTGVHIAFDPGTYGKIESKSGLNVKYSVVSCGGVIDEGYTGSITVKLYNMGNKPYRVRKGDKIAQLVIMEYKTPKIELVSHLDETERGDGAFGSTGR